MKELLMKIYNSILVYEDDVVNVSKVIDDEINLLVEPYQTRLSDDELETLKDLLSSTALTAEQTGFEVGMRFAMKLIFSLLSD